MLHVCVHGAHAIIKMGTLKYSNGLTGMPASSNLRNLTTSRYIVLIPKNANEKMPNMFLIVYLNENLRYCNENWGWGKQETLIHPYMFWYTTKDEKAVTISFYLIFL